MKIKRLVSSFVELLIRRPWLPAAAFLAPLLLALVSGVLLLANVRPYRFLPEFPDELIVALSNTGGWLAVFIAPGFAVEMLVLPVVLLFFRFARPAGRRMLAASICALPIGFVLYVMILVLILLADIGHTEIARENIERKKEAERLGKKTPTATTEYLVRAAIRDQNTTSSPTNGRITTFGRIVLMAASCWMTWHAGMKARTGCI